MLANHTSIRHLFSHTVQQYDKLVRDSWDPVGGQAYWLTTPDASHGLNSGNGGAGCGVN